MKTDWRWLVANVISGISLLCLIIFGISYLKFKNANIHEDVQIRVTNNPVLLSQPIHMELVAQKNFSCQSKEMYGIARLTKDNKVIKTLILDEFIKSPIKNQKPGTVVNEWTFNMPEGMTEGNWHIDLVGKANCQNFVFTLDKKCVYDNILLEVKNK